LRKKWMKLLLVAKSVIIWGATVTFYWWKLILLEMNAFTSRASVYRIYYWTRFAWTANKELLGDSLAFKQEDLKIEVTLWSLPAEDQWMIFCRV
jgi:hypothetical protein